MKPFQALVKRNVQSYIAQPKYCGSYKEVYKRLKFIERFNCLKVIDSQELNELLLTRWWYQVYRKVFSSCQQNPNAYRKFFGLAKSKTLWDFPRCLAGCELTIEGGMGVPGKLVIKRRGRWQGVEEVRNSELVVLNRRCRLLAQIKDSEKSGELACDRVSSRGVRHWKRQRGQTKNGYMYTCSASSGAGLVGLEGFLRRVLASKAETLLFTHRNRLGRVSWVGEAEVLKACGVKVRFLEEGAGVVAGGRSNLEGGRGLGRALAGCVVLPRWVLGGGGVGEVCLVGGRVALEVLGAEEVAPGDDVRLEHWLLRWGVRGVRKPVRLLGPVSGECFKGGARRVLGEARLAA